MTDTLPAYTLLMVDDNPADLRLMEEAIRIAGLDEIMRIECACSGEEGWQKIETARMTLRTFDLVLLDLNMPRAGGRSLLLKIRSEQSLATMPVFIVTNSDYASDIRSCMDMGADAYMQKPTDFMRLVDFFSSVRRTLLSSQRIFIPEIERHYEAIR